MHEVRAADAVVGGGLQGDLQVSLDRGVTLISSRQWKAVTSELGVELPWYTRRANVLIDADGLGGLIGKNVRIGAVELEIRGETRPCGLMDQLHDGLRQALVPDCRGGVHGKVVKGGTVRVGDVVQFSSDAAR